VWLVAVTEDGARCTEAVREIDEILRAELRQGIDRAERQALASLMTRLQHNLRTAIRNTQ
jgi:DNA-binding MarR family transcriptional regulator